MMKIKAYILFDPATGEVIAQEDSYSKVTKAIHQNRRFSPDQISVYVSTTGSYLNGMDF